MINRLFDNRLTNNQNYLAARGRNETFFKSDLLMSKKSTETLQVQSKSRKNLFQPGRSGNPAGRKPGSGIVGELRQQLQSAAPEIIEKLIENAKLGDPTSVRLVVERLVPLHKPQLPAISIDTPRDATPVQLAQTVLQAALSGAISPDQAQSIISLQTSITALRESEELERRLLALEQKAIDV